MRVVLVSIGTLSNLQPLVAVAVGLRALGLLPVIAASENCQAVCSHHGIEFAPLRPSPAQIMSDLDIGEAEFWASLVTDWNFALKKAMLPYAAQTLADLRQAYVGADLVITTNAAILGRIAADAAGIRKMAILLQPITLSNAQVPPVLPGLGFLPALRRSLGPWAVKPFLALIQQASKHILRPFAEVRRAAGAPPFSGNESRDGVMATERVFTLFSPRIGSLPPGTPSHVVPCGFTFCDTGFSAAGLAPDLRAFLDEGSPPIVFTLGSLAVTMDADFCQASAEAAASLGRRAILLVGDGQIDKYRHLKTADVFVSGYAPHSAIFPQAAAVVHHGGIGTIAQVMRAGIPHLVCPRYGDQFDNAARIKAHRLGDTLPFADYSAAGATAALARILADEGLLAQARSVGQEVAKEDGALVMARHIAEWGAADESAAA